MDKDTLYTKIFNVISAHHDDISKEDEDRVMECTEDIYATIKDLREKCWVLQGGRGER